MSENHIALECIARFAHVVIHRQLLEFATPCLLTLEHLLQVGRRQGAGGFETGFAGLARLLHGGQLFGEDGGDAFLFGEGGEGDF